MKVLIAEDHAIVREGLRRVVAERAPDLEIAEAGSCAQALAALADRAITLILLDLGLPDASDIDALERIRAAAPDLPVIVFSADDGADRVLRCIEAGARCFVPKSADTETFGAALGAVLAGAVWVPETTIAAQARDLAAESVAGFRARMSEAVATLTPRQREVLHLIIDGLSNKGIGRALSISPETAKIHVSGVLKALGVPNRARAIVAASAAGLQLPARLSPAASTL
ncbi:MAG: response regulator transcription factor [Burkholderiales bacterium]|nr:response regulator transcription factor [Burkholderiales bacterium]